MSAGAHRSLKIINLLMFLIGFSALCALVAEYGFGLPEMQTRFMHKLQFYGVYVFCALQLSKLIFVENPLRYLIKRWLDFMLVFLMFFQLAVGFGLQGMPEYVYLVKTGNSVPLAWISLAVVQIYFITVALLESRFLAHLLLGLKLNPMMVFAFSFLGLVGAGYLAILLPKATAAGQYVAPSDLFFVVASAASGTGLSTIDVAAKLSILGQSILLLLMQVGPFGIIAFLTLLTLLSGDKIGKEEEGSFTAVINVKTVAGAKNYLISILGIMFFLEVLTGVYFYFFSGYSNTFFMKVFYAAFHAASAFTNTGLALYPNGDFSIFVKHLPLLIWVMVLMFLGSLGNMNLIELPKAVANWLRRDYGKISADFKSLVYVNVIVIAIALPLAYFALAPNALKGMSHLEGIVNTMFAVLSSRSSGLCTINLSMLGNMGVAVFFVLMVIGGGPISFAGGIRTISVSVIYAYIKNKIFGGKGSNPTLFGKTVFPKTVKKVFVITGSYLCVLAIGVTAVYFIENFEFKKVLFEVTSGIGTTGLSMGITPLLSVPSKMIISFCMLFGAFVHPLAVITVNYFDKSKDDIVVG